MPSKRPERAGKSEDVKPAAKPAQAKSAPAGNMTSAKSVWSAGAIAVGLLGVVAVAMLFASRGSTPPAGTVVASAEPAASAPSSPAVKKSAATRPAAAPAANAVESAPAGPKLSGAVTVTGCLQRADAGFRLKDTDGSAAPTSRSWKSGFLKKGRASIDLDDSSNAAHLAQFVGQRVSVTGTLIDREMHVQSLRRIAPTCD